MLILLKYGIKNIENRPKKFNKDSFIIFANLVYDDKYDYSKMIYVNQSTPITIVCPIHGDFVRTPSYHLQGGHCPKCSKINMIKNGKKPMTEESLEKRKITCLERYGSESYIASTQAKDRFKDSDVGPWSECAKLKREKTSLEKYGSKTWSSSDVGKKFALDLSSNPDFRNKISKGVRSSGSREKYKKTSMENCGAEHWTKSKDGNQKLRNICNTKEERLKRSERMLSDEVKSKIQETCLKKYGVPYYWQSVEGRLRLKELLNSDEVISKTRLTNLKLYGSEFWSSSDIGRRTLSSDSIIQKSINTKKENGTIHGSGKEKLVYDLLSNKFGEDDVICQYKDLNIYPFLCDFYIKSLDLFIELNIYWTHGGHFFDKSNKDDVSKLLYWSSRKTDAFDKAVYTWSISDLNKRDTAIKNNINYLVFWDNDLSDFKEWFYNLK